MTLLGTSADSRDTRQFNARDLRPAFGHFPTGVCVITGMQPDGTPFGLTVSSFQTLSLDPALILYSVRRGAASLDFLSRRACFAVNILQAGQDWIARQFASHCRDRFASVAWQASRRGNPLLHDALARFECSVWKTYDGGDHVIVIGQINDIDGLQGGKPLIFHRGGFVPVPDLRSSHHPADGAPT